MHKGLCETAALALVLTVEKSAIKNSVKGLFKELVGEKINKSASRNSRGVLACAAPQQCQKENVVCHWAAVSHLLPSYHQARTLKQKGRL